MLLFLFLFLITLAKEIRARPPFDQEVFQLLEFLDPKVATSGKVSSLRPISEKFPSFYSQEVIEKVDIEWRSFILNCPPVDSIIKDDCTIGDEKFWEIVSELKDGSQQIMYPLLSGLAQDLLTLPITNAIGSGIK